MRKIVAGLFVSLDGVVESPDKWQFPYFNDEMGEEVSAQMDAADAMLLGRKTYQEFASFWPNAPADDPVHRPHEQHAQVRRLHDAWTRSRGRTRR